MNGTHRALVAGASIAGVATATALHHLGWEVDLAERRQIPAATIPAGLFLPANAMRAFAALGAAESLHSRGQTVARMRLRGAGCYAEGVAELADIWPEAGPCVAIGRGTALAALLGRCPVPVRSAAGLQFLSQCGTRVGVGLAGGSRSEYDLVVGADGAYSTVRGLLWPDVRPRYGGESWWRGVALPRRPGPGGGAGAGARGTGRRRLARDHAAMRNSLAALSLADRVGFVVPNWAELSASNFAWLVPEP